MKKLVLVIMVMVLGTSLLACGKTETVETNSHVDNLIEDTCKKAEEMKDEMLEEAIVSYEVAIREIFEEELSNGCSIEINDFGVSCGEKTVSWKYVGEFAFNYCY